MFILLNASQAKTSRVRQWQVIVLLLFLIGIVSTLLQLGTIPNGSSYLLAMVIGAVPLIVSLFGTWTRTKFLTIGAMLAVLCLIIFIRLIPGQLDGGRLSLLARYTTFQSAVKTPAEVNPAKPDDPDFLQGDYTDYLKTGYANDNFSSLWIWGLAGAVLLGLIALDNRFPTARKVLLWGGIAFFALFTISAFHDGQIYFNAYSDIADKTSTPLYHFRPFNDAISAFPDDTRVPLWTDSDLWTKPSLILITVWSSGAAMLIFLAALKGVPPQLYEAADVDGANRIQKFVSITLPMISPAMFYNIIIGVIAALQTFDVIYVFANNGGGGNLVPQIQSAAYFLYVTTFTQVHIGEGAAISWILAIIIMTATVLQFRYSNWVYYEV